MQLADQGNLRHILSSNFLNNILSLWIDKIRILYNSSMDLSNLHNNKLRYIRKDFHNGKYIKR